MEAEWTLILLIIASLAAHPSYPEEAVHRGSTYIINVYDDFLEYHLCIGSYIRNYWVLTSAICAYKARNSSRPILIASDVKQKDEAQHRGPVSFAIHPNYSGTTKINNIALIELSSPFTLGRDVDTIGLPKPPLEPVRCSLMGWRFRSKTDHFDYVVVMSVKAKKLTTGECLELLKASNTNYEYVENEMLCVWDALCMVDDGAPLLCEGRLYGVMSFTTCSATVIESAKFHKNWIDMTTATITKRDMAFPDPIETATSSHNLAIPYIVVTFLSFCLCILYYLRFIK